MKISIFSAFYPFRGGIAQFNARLFRELEKKNEVKAFTFIKQYPSILFPGSDQLVKDNDPADRIPAERIVNTFNPITYFSARQKIKKSSAELFIANYWMSLFGVLTGMMSSALKGRAVRIAIIHNLVPHEPKFFDRCFNSYFVRRFDGFIVMSDKVEKNLKELNPLARYLKIAHPYYDHFGDKIDRNQAALKLGLDPAKKTLLFFGLIRKYKGLDLLIQAFSELDEGYQLLIAGEFYEDEDKYLDLVRENSNSKHIYIINKYIPDNEVSLYFSAADLCILPYRSATQSGITATAMHFEIPLIATNVGGLKESVGDAGIGVMVDQPSSSHLRNAIVDYFESDNKEYFVENIRRKKQQDSWAEFAVKVIEFSRSLK